MTNNELIQVFEDTKSHSEKMLNSETTLHSFDDRLISDVNIPCHENIQIINSDSVSTITEYSKLGKTCVLNMASYKHPGGGVARGSKAQEECLFRCSNLTHAINTDNYPLGDDKALYTKNAVFFKDVNYNYMSDVKSDVITIAALNLNTVKVDFDDYSDTITKENILSINLNYEKISKLDYEKLTKEKIRLMLSLAIKNDVDIIILGSFGCGVFRNDPEEMAKMFKYLLVKEGYSKYFEKVIFAIINDRNSVGNNYEIFKNVFSDYNLI